MLAIVDYGVGNLRSVAEALQRVKVDVVISKDKASLAAATHLILPGVGRFAHCMEQFTSSPIYEDVAEAVLERKVPTLGICVGMQMLANHSEEGDVAGLGWVPGKVKRFPDTIAEKSLRVPHVAWNQARIHNDNKTAANLLRTEGLGVPQRFYFTHSYYFSPNSDAHLLAHSFYGLRFAAMVGKDNIHGVQFHPERSHESGLKLLSQFAALT